MTIVLETDNDDDDEETRCLRIRISERNGRADGWEWSADGERMEMSGGMGKTDMGERKRLGELQYTTLPTSQQATPAAASSPQRQHKIAIGSIFEVRICWVGGWERRV
ncbi:unnamed protein product [Nippostrongylus brasiliensis]|uniref:Uncharacterized protein n=1 Tax=Nippostrongylus brasiliensis TaxID=27835 RepID=A0A0N4XGI6_NIPBR|nr:unnamed protein product [Nippostrongylus brasiliensis]